MLQLAECGNKQANGWMFNSDRLCHTSHPIMDYGWYAKNAQIIRGMRTCIRNKPRNFSVSNKT